MFCGWGVFRVLYFGFDYYGVWIVLFLLFGLFLVCFGGVCLCGFIGCCLCFIGILIFVMVVLRLLWVGFVGLCLGV